MPTDFSKADKLVNATMKAGLSELGNDVKRRAIVLAPILTGALRSSARSDVSSAGEKVTISFNTPYSNRRHWENNLHPETKYYLTNSLKSIKNVGKYFKPFN